MAVQDPLLHPNRQSPHFGVSLSRPAALASGLDRPEAAWIDCEPAEMQIAVVQLVSDIPWEIAWWWVVRLGQWSDAVLRRNKRLTM